MWPNGNCEIKMSNRLSRRDLLLASTCLMFSPPLLIAEEANGRWRRDFDRFIRDGLARVKVPGLGVAMIRKDKTLLTAGYGLADVKNRVAVTADTAFHMASVSKLVTATAMMQLQEAGLCQLDDPIGPHLDFEVVNPAFPNRPITFRHLYMHTSSISDDVEDATSAFQVAGDPTLPLEAFLKGYLSPSGKWYDPKKTFTDAAPGEKWQYSNVGIGLLGYLAGRVGSVSLDPLTKRQLFDPLRMHNTSWKISGIHGQLVEPYEYAANEFKELPPTGYPDWPAGMLRSSPRDFARFLTIFTNGGRVGGKRYLKGETLRTFLDATPIPTAAGVSFQQGLVWEIRGTGDDAIVEHAGIDPGTTTLASVKPNKGTAALVFANITGHKELGRFMREVAGRLHDRASE
jgi:CubicO group peptidase (beta-lactamase class C family)